MFYAPLRSWQRVAASSLILVPELFPGGEKLDTALSKQSTLVLEGCAR